MENNLKVIETLKVIENHLKVIKNNTKTRKIHLRLI